MIEVHNDPPNALCDGAQALTCDAFADVMTAMAAVRNAIFPA
jgi:3-deoxy-7-phosphoheptulonate synthase